MILVVNCFFYKLRVHLDTALIKKNLLALLTALFGCLTSQLALIEGF